MDTRMIIANAIIEDIIVVSFIAFFTWLICTITENVFCRILGRVCDKSEVVNKMGNRQNNWIVKKFRELRKERGGRCIFCDTSKSLEFAHIKETGLRGNSGGRKERYYDIKNNPKSYILLCKPCLSWITGLHGKEISNLNPQVL